MVAVIASLTGNAAIGGNSGNASNQGETDLSGGGVSASLRGSRWNGAPISSKRSLAAAIAGIASNRAIAGNSGASGQPVADEDVSVLEPDPDGPTDF